MTFSRLSDEEAREIVAAAADPAYREIGRVEGTLDERNANRTPDERLQQLVNWLRFLEGLGVDLTPNREPTKANIALL